MAEVELSYNPYTLKTNIKFNRKEPRVNSLIEKYQNKRLQEWIEFMPQIFYDEMNGFGFKLKFSGTKLDYENIKKQFNLKCGPNESIEYEYEKEIEGAKKIQTRIKDLLSWLKQNKCSQFDYKKFERENEEIVDFHYTVYFLNGQKVKSVNICGNICDVESIVNINKIGLINIKNAPIFIYIKSLEDNVFENEIKKIIENENIDKKQLFFIVEPLLNKAIVERTLVDLNIEKPQIVTTVNTDMIEEYFEGFTMPLYISKAINVFNRVYENIDNNFKKIIKEEKKDTNKKQNEIQRIDEEIDLIKKVEKYLNNQNAYDVEKAFSNTEDIVLGNIGRWKKGKINLIGENNGERAAKDFDLYNQQNYRKFRDNIKIITKNTKIEIEEIFKNLYDEVSFDNFTPFKEIVITEESEELIKLYNDYINYKSEEYVDQNNGILDLFFKNNNSKDKVLEKIYNLEKWKNKAEEEYRIIIEKIIKKREIILTQYYKSLKTEYYNRLSGMLEKRIELKENLITQLTEKEKILQKELEWFKNFEEKLFIIKGEKKA